MCQLSHCSKYVASRIWFAFVFILMTLACINGARAQVNIAITGKVQVLNDDGIVKCAKLKNEKVEFGIVDYDLLSLNNESVFVKANCGWINRGRLKTPKSARLNLYFEYMDYVYYYSGENKPLSILLVKEKPRFQGATITLKSRSRASRDAFRVAKGFLPPVEDISPTAAAEIIRDSELALDWMRRSRMYALDEKRLNREGDLLERLDRFEECAKRFGDAEIIATKTKVRDRAEKHRYRKLVCIHRHASTVSTVERWEGLRAECNATVIHGFTYKRGQILGICLDALIESSESEGNFHTLANEIVKRPELSIGWKTLYYMGNKKSAFPEILQLEKVIKNLKDFSIKLGRPTN